MVWGIVPRTRFLPPNLTSLPNQTTFVLLWRGVRMYEGMDLAAPQRMSHAVDVAPSSLHSIKLWMQEALHSGPFVWRGTAFANKAVAAVCAYTVFPREQFLRGMKGEETIIRRMNPLLCGLNDACRGCNPFVSTSSSLSVALGHATGILPRRQKLQNPEFDAFGVPNSPRLGCVDVVLVPSSGVFSTQSYSTVHLVVQNQRSLNVLRHGSANETVFIGEIPSECFVARIPIQASPLRNETLAEVKVLEQNGASAEHVLHFLLAKSISDSLIKNCEEAAACLLHNVNGTLVDLQNVCQDKKSFCCGLPMICRWCGQRYLTLSGLQDHGCKKYKRQQQNNDNEDDEEKPVIFCCATCGLGFPKYSALEMHERGHSGDKPYICDWCGRGFVTHSLLTSHLLVHSGQKEYSCSLCGVFFTSKQERQLHLMRHNTTTEHHSISCVWCGKVFASQSECARHQLTHDGNLQDTAACLFCRATFSSKRSLKQHLQTHTGCDMKRKCDTCGKSFRHIGHLTQHEKIHTQEKPFVCGVCGRSFAQEGNLVVHKRQHSTQQKKPFPCPHCPKSFTRNAALKRHRLKCP